MIKDRKIFSSISLVCGLCYLTFLLASCGGKHQDVLLDEEDTTDTLTKITRSSLACISINMPSPIKVTEEISGAGIGYDRTLVNPSSKLSSYSTNYQKALNLGIYGTDLGYVTGFKQMQDALGYVGAVKRMSEELGVSGAYDEKILKRIIENLSKADSAEAVAELIDEVYSKAERNLRSKERVEVAGLVIAGGWLEGLHIATTALGTMARNDKSENLYNRIWEQAYAYRYILDLFNDNIKNPDFLKLTEAFKDIQILCKTLEGKPKLNNTDILLLKGKITEARNKITG